MTILIINNYEKEEDQSKVNQITDTLKNMGKAKYQIWKFSELQEKAIPEELEALILSGSRAHLQNPSHLSRYETEIELIRTCKRPDSRNMLRSSTNRKGFWLVNQSPPEISVRIHKNQSA